MFNRLRVRLREGFRLLNGVVLIIGHGVTRNRLIAARWYGCDPTVPRRNRSPVEKLRAPPLTIARVILLCAQRADAASGAVARRRVFNSPKTQSIPDTVMSPAINAMITGCWSYYSRRVLIVAALARPGCRTVMSFSQTEEVQSSPARARSLS